jgi:hypothetical protein
MLSKGEIRAFATTILGPFADYSAKTIDRFRECEKTLRVAAAMLRRVDWLVSGNDGEDTFHERWDKEVDNHGETMMRCKCTKHEIGDGPIECGTLIHTEDFCGGRHAYEIVLRDRKISELEVKVAELSGHYVVLEKLTVETRDALKDLRTLLVEKGLSWTASSDDLKF